VTYSEIMIVVHIEDLRIDQSTVAISINSAVAKMSGMTSARLDKLPNRNALIRERSRDFRCHQQG